MTKVMRQKVWAACGCAAVLAASPLAAGQVSVGDVYLCHSDGNLPPVEVVVGKLETLGDVLSAEHVEADLAETRLVHLQMRGVSQEPLPEVGHSPFQLSALAMCEAVSSRHGAGLTGDFEGGYAMWKEAVVNDGAGFFTVNPAEAYWQMLGVIGQ